MFVVSDTVDPGQGPCQDQDQGEADSAPADRIWPGRQGLICSRGCGLAIQSLAGPLAQAGREEHVCVFVCGAAKLIILCICYRIFRFLRVGIVTHAEIGSSVEAKPWSHHGNWGRV